MDGMIPPSHFVELEHLLAIIEKLGVLARVEVVEHIDYQGQSFPIHCLSLGTQKPDAPVIAYFGGVHGLEKIGTEVLLAYLQTIVELMTWDEEFAARLDKVRLVFMPIVNPVGVFRGTRCNGNGVDLMRNAPIDGVGKIKLYSGHHISPHLPWYRGDQLLMEKEARALCRVMRDQFASSPLVIAVDLHSGFGIHDRVWFPYASCKKPFDSLPEAYALKQLFDRCYPHHFYKIEPMSQEYVISGDLWDYLYDEFRQQCKSEALFMPLTLEMGSWLWLRKNPTHLFLRHGLFHPVLPHRQQRILRRHLILFDFLFRAALFPKSWAHLNTEDRESKRQQAMAFWYE